MEKEPWNRTVLIWEIGCLLFLVLIGPLLHFVYEWSGYSDVIALFAPVNESVWEHLKMGFWSLTVFSVAEYFFVRRRTSNFWPAKFLGAAAQALTIVIVFYTYTSITGRPILAIDIGSYVLGALISGALALIVYFKTRPALPASIAGGTGLAVLALCFMLFTYATPRFELFRDGRNGAYGPVKTEIGEY